MAGSTPAARLDATIVGKRLLEEVPAEVPGVQVDVVGAGGPQHPVDALGHHVTRGQLGQLVLAEHEPLAGVVDQVGALAAQRLGDQRPLHRGDARR